MVMGELTQETEVLVVGGGPGGYAAAFRAADHGLDVTMVDSDPRPGGVCLFRGCIPSKTLLFVTELMYDIARCGDMGLKVGSPQLDLAGLRAWKERVTDKLASGLVNLTKKRNIQWIQARATFETSDRVRLEGSDVKRIKFRHAILATGSHATGLPGIEFREGGRIMDSTGALELVDVPERLLVVGGGYVGFEMGSVYAALGSRVTLIERGPVLLPYADRDLTKPLLRRVGETFEAVKAGTSVKSIREQGERVEVELEGDVERPDHQFDRVLVAIGRTPNSQGIGLENTAVRLNERGCVVVDERQRTSDARIFAVGDVVGGAMLAHKAMHEGRVAADVIAGLPAAFDVRAIPSVVYTDPQIAVCGLTEEQAQREGRPVRVAHFPWSASGRAMTMGATEGLTKLVFDPDSGRVLGVGIVGRSAGEMISEGVLAIEMGALAEDVASTMHPHPTLSETEEEAAGAFLGTATHIVAVGRK